MRIQVNAGSPDVAEIAAVTTALVGLAAAPGPPPPVVRSAWSRANRFEQIGQAPFHTSRDSRLVHRPSGALSPGSQRADD